MRRIALPLLVLALIAVAVVATRTCETESAPADPTTIAEPNDEERVARRRVDATARTEADAVEDEWPVSADLTSVDAASEPHEWIDGRDPELALARRFLSGVVVDADDAPMAGVAVRLTSHWLPEVVARAADRSQASLADFDVEIASPAALLSTYPALESWMTTGEDGRFRLPYVVGDDLWISANAFGYRAPVERPHEEFRIVLTDALSQVDVTVVRASDGLAVEGALVMLAAAKMGVALTETDATGFANLGVSASGRGKLSVSARGLACVEDRPVDLSFGESLEVRIELAPEYLVRGRIVDDETGRPIAGARVGSGVPRHWREPPTNASDADGRFEIRGMPVVERTSRAVGAIAEGYVPVARWLPSELPSEGFREVELRMVRGGSIRLRCVDGSGTPVSNALVYAEGDVSRGGPDRYARSMDINGGAVWTERGGVAVISDLPHDNDPLEVRIYFRGVEVVRRECPAPAAGETVDLGDVVVALGGRLTGTVRTAEGAPAAGVAVVVVPDDPADEHLYGLADAALYPPDERHGVTDAEGRFEIPGLSPGTWHALAWTEGSEHAPRLVRGIVVPVEGDSSPIAIRLPVPVVIHGVALDEDGTPMVGVEIGALRDSPVGINLMEMTTTDEHGRFRLPGVSALGERVWVEIDHGDCRGELITVGRAPLELHFDRLGHFDPDEHDRSMGR